MLRSAARATTRLGAMGFGMFALACMTIGCCYFLRQPTAHWPGPRISQALPLDQLASHASVSFIVFALAVAVGGLLCGLLARVLGFDGFAIALSVGAGIGGIFYVSSAISYFVVNQTSLDQAFDATSHLQPIYLAAALFALGVALVARRKSGEQWLTRIIPTCVGLFGVIEMLSATLPQSRAEHEALGGLFIGPSSPLTRTIGVSVGIVLLLASRGLSRRSRRALAISAALVFVVLVAQLIDATTNVTAILVGALVLLALATRRGDFSFAGDPVTRFSGLYRAVGVSLVALAYGVVALLLNRIAAGLKVHFVPLVKETIYAFAIGSTPNAAIIPDRFATWFPWSLRILVGGGLAWGAVTAFAPWRHRLREGDEQRQRAQVLVETFGEDTLAPFALRHDKALYFYPEQCGVESATTVIAYRVVRGVAIVSGDPIGPPEQAGEAIRSFRRLCAARGWRFSLLGASERHLDAYRNEGLRCLYHGDEAVVETATFSLGGGEMKSVRQAANRLARNGYRVEIRVAGALSEGERGELVALEERWLAGAKRKGFVMELDELFRLDGDDAVFVVGRGPHNELVGFLEIAVCPASSSLSLSSMPREKQAPNGLNATLIVAAIGWAKEHGFEALSLNFSPAARLLDAKADCHGWRRVARRLTLVMKRLLGLQLDNLLVFNRHFLPDWHSRYLVIEHFRDLPRVLVAAMAAERYAPFSDLLRGRGWAVPAVSEESGALSR